LKRGEIWTASGGADYAGKPRPVVIVQDDNFDRTASITICPLTIHGIDAGLVRPSIEPAPGNGLRDILGHGRQDHDDGARPIR
jgi:mRNA interferase MazF